MNNLKFEEIRRSFKVAVFHTRIYRRTFGVLLLFIIAMHNLRQEACFLRTHSCNFYSSFGGLF